MMSRLTSDDSALRGAESIRTAFKKGDDVRDAGLTTPDSIVRNDDIVYGQDPTWNLLDVYRPADATGPLPCIVSVHGGAWVYGDKELYQYYCMDLATRGFAVVNFTYRLAPEHRYPAALQDTADVFSWVAAHAADYGIDPENVFVVGDSAGAQIASQYLAAVTNESYGAVVGIEPPRGIAIRACALNCGDYDLLSKSAGPATAFAKFYLPADRVIPREELDVIGAITSDFPPTYLLTAPQDFLREENLRFAPLLRERGVECVLQDEPQENLGHVFHLAIRDDAARRTNDAECAFFRAHLAGVATSGQ